MAVREASAHVGAVGQTANAAHGGLAGTERRSRSHQKLPLWQPTGKSDDELRERAINRARESRRPWLFSRDERGRLVYALPNGSIVSQ
jgi:hypothetical protein